MFKFSALFLILELRYIAIGSGSLGTSSRFELVSEKEYSWLEITGTSKGINKEEDFSLGENERGIHSKDCEKYCLFGECMKMNASCVERVIKTMRYVPLQKGRLIGMKLRNFKLFYQISLEF